MRFRVIGTDQTNRKPIDTVFEATSLERAGMLAKMKKINVTSIEPMDEEVVGTARIDPDEGTRSKSKPLILVVVLVVIVMTGVVVLRQLGWLEI